MSVVVPMHATRASLPELLDRLGRAVPGAQVVLVDDACPEGSGGVARALGDLPGGLHGMLVDVRPGVGQQSAVLIGLAWATAATTVVMDADLQDPPEAIPSLVAALAAGTAPVVASARRGTYESPGRLATARSYRLLLHWASRRRIPCDAGMFLAMDRSARDAVLALGDPVAPLVPALARAGQTIRTVPVHRRSRRHGVSATTGRVRARTAVRGLVTVLPVHPLARTLRVLRWQHPSVTVTDLGGHR